MTTRGLMGFVIDGTEKLSYNHSDSYPEWLGVKVLKWARSVSSWEEIKQAAKKIILVEEDDTPTAKQIEQVRQCSHLTVSNQSKQNWYSLLREAQGNLGAYLEAGYMIGAGGFAANSLFCEWGYVLDLDEAILEVYKGFQHSPHSQGRFSDLPIMDQYSLWHVTDNIYYPIAKVAQWPLESLPTDEGFLATLNQDPEEERASCSI